MANILSNIALAAFRAGITPRTNASRTWFRQQAAKLGRVNRNSLMKSDDVELSGRELIGSMQMYFYQPKHANSLKYYDRFPLSIIMGPADGGFMGLNLHYLPPILRAKFLDALLDITNNKKYDQSTKFNATYSVLKKAAKFKYFKPCVKHYLSQHVKSRFAKVNPPEWEIATFLPTADFAKASRSTVYTDSRKAL